MHLLTQAIRRKLPPLYANEEQGTDALAIVKFFTPDSSWTWYASEFDGDDLFSGYGAPVAYDEDGQAHEIPGWQDHQPREQWGSVDIPPAGVLRLAQLYGRPYVRLEESPALLAHWQLVQTESAARERRLEMGWDEAQWAREWPERAMLRQARLAQEEYDAGEDKD